MEKKFKVPSENHFKGEVYCAENEMLVINNLNYLKIKFYAKIDMDTFDNKSTEEIKKRFLDFESWPKILEDKEILNFIASKKRPSLKINNKKIMRHYTNYYMQMPSLLTSHQVHDVCYYWEENPIEGADCSILFKSDNNNFHYISEKMKFHGAISFLDKHGEIHIGKDELKKEFQIYSVIYVAPTFNILPSVILPYVEEAITSLFKGLILG